MFFLDNCATMSMSMPMIRFNNTLSFINMPHEISWPHVKTALNISFVDTHFLVLPHPNASTSYCRTLSFDDIDFIHDSHHVINDSKFHISQRFLFKTTSVLKVQKLLLADIS